MIHEAISTANATVTQIMIVWGEESFEELTLYGIRKLVIDPNIPFHLEFSLSVTYRDSTLEVNSEKNGRCLNELFINIVAYPLFSNRPHAINTSELMVNGLPATESSNRVTDTVGESYVVITDFPDKILTRYLQSTCSNHSTNMLQSVLVPTVLTFVFVILICLNKRCHLKWRNIFVRNEHQTGSQYEHNTRSNENDESMQMTRFSLSQSYGARNSDFPLDECHQENGRPVSKNTECDVSDSVLPSTSSHSKVIFCNERSYACSHAKIRDDCNRQGIDDNDGATGTTENIYSAVDDVRVLDCGSSNAYNYMNSDMFSFRTFSPSCGQLPKLHDPIPENDCGVLHSLRRNQNRSSSNKGHHENYPEGLYAVSSKFHKKTNDRIIPPSSSDGNSSHQGHPSSSALLSDGERYDIDVSCPYNTLNLQEGNETSAVPIPTPISSSSMMLTTSNDSTSFASPTMINDPLTSNYDSLSRPAVVDYIGKL